MGVHCLESGWIGLCILSNIEIFLGPPDVPQAAPSGRFSGLRKPLVHWECAAEYIPPLGSVRRDTIMWECKDLGRMAFQSLQIPILGGIGCSQVGFWGEWPATRRPLEGQTMSLLPPNPPTPPRISPSISLVLTKPFPANYLPFRFQIGSPEFLKTSHPSVYVCVWMKNQVKKYIWLWRQLPQERAATPKII